MKTPNGKQMNKGRILLFFILIFSEITAQETPKITSEINTNQIKIGEQIQYKISVEAKTNDKVQFPQGQTFIPMEMVSESAVDTFRQQEKIRLVKNYYLTNFDSGSYIIPKQRVAVNQHFFETDSLLLSVRNVAVDTLKQPLYTIKPPLKIEKTHTHLWYILGGVFLLLLLVALLVYLFFFRKKALSEDEKIAALPPFNRALFLLEKLQKSRYLLESKHKEYYTELTDIVRHYLEEELKISATEYTSEELVERIEFLSSEKKLHISEEVIKDFRSVLRKADLVKFAKSQPEDNEAETDRKVIENVVVKTQEAIPVEMLEERMKNEAFQRKLKEIKRKQRLVWVGVLLTIFTFFTLVAGLGAFGYYHFFVKGTSSEYLREKAWITSVYGNPLVRITTPLVMERVEKRKALSLSKSQFSMGEKDKFFVNLITFDAKDIASEQPEEIFQKITQIIVKNIEKTYEAQNIFTKYEDYTTPQGAQGVKIFGNFQDKKSKFGGRINFEYLVFFKEKEVIVLGFHSPKSSESVDRQVINAILLSLKMD